MWIGRTLKLWEQNFDRLRYPPLTYIGFRYILEIGVFFWLRCANPDELWPFPKNQREQPWGNNHILIIIGNKTSPSAPTIQRIIILLVAIVHPVYHSLFTRPLDGSATAFAAVRERSIDSTYGSLFVIDWTLKKLPTTAVNNKLYTGR